VTRALLRQAVLPLCVSTAARTSFGRHTGTLLAIRGTGNRSKGTDNRSKGTDNRSKGTENRSKGTDDRSRVLTIGVRVLIIGVRVLIIGVRVLMTIAFFNALGQRTSFVKNSRKWRLRRTRLRGRTCART
jgi:hypothetical protein